jgi:hypothetical protein
MPAGVVLDTSFLICMADPARANHGTAVDYWRYFIEQRIPVFLPTIVVSEFCVRQEIPKSMLSCCVVLPFNWDDAIKAAALDFKKSPGTGQRDALKDDVKILAQAAVQDAAWVITDDAASFFKFARRLADEQAAAFHPLKLEDGFDISHFQPGGQRLLNLAESDEIDF